MNYYLVCNLYIYNKIYMYLHTHTCTRMYETSCKRGLENILKKGKAVAVYDTITELYLVQILLSGQNRTQSRHPHRISSLTFPTALICADAVSTVWFLGLPSRTEDIKMPEAPLAWELQQLCLQVWVSPLGTLMPFFLFFLFFNVDAGRGQEEDSWWTSPL